MKKRVVWILLIVFTCSGLFAIDDYALGYLQGYEDAIHRVYSEFVQLLDTLYDEAGLDDSSTDSTVETDYGDWQLYYYVDSFGDYTNEAYLSSGIQDGTFSNSATTNSKLEWQFLIDNDDIAIMLWEYGSYVVHGSSNYPDVYNLQVKDATGKTYEFRFKNSSDRLYVSDYNSFLALLRTNPNLKIVIKEVTTYSPSVYNLGSVDFKGFDAMYQKLIKK